MSAGLERRRRVDPERESVKKKSTQILLAVGVLVAIGMVATSGLAQFGQSSAVEGRADVQPGINDSWRSSDIDPLIGRLERDDREIFRERKNLAALVGPRRGSVIADVGAGSGFMAEEFSNLVGESGRVIAVDINSTMLGNLANRAKQAGLDNLETRVCTETSSKLLPDSVDLVFICDTYHHFEYPKSTMKSIHKALRSGGQLVVVDFRRIPGESEAWMLEHVRAGEEVFRQEILEAGFELTNAHYPPFLKDNYVLRFRKAKGVG